METIKIVVLRGCDSCGTQENLAPNECLCDRCLARSFKKEIQALPDREYLSSEFRARQIDNYTARLKQILSRSPHLE